MFFKKKAPYPDGIFYVDVKGDKSKFRLRVGNGYTDPDKTPFICDSEGHPIEITIKRPNEIVESATVVEEPNKESSDTVNAANPDIMMGNPLGGLMSAFGNCMHNEISVDYVFSKEFFKLIINSKWNNDSIIKICF